MASKPIPFKTIPLLHRRRSPRTNAQPASNLTDSVRLPFYQQFFARANDSIFIVSADGIVQYVNPAGEALCKGAKTGNIKTYLKKILSTNELNKFENALSSVRAKLYQKRFEVNGVDEISFEMTLVPLVQKRLLCGYYLNLRDMSHERQIQEIVSETKKMEALQFFVSGTTKEIQHPLLAILKSIEGVEQRYSGRTFEYVSSKEFGQMIAFLKTIRKQVEMCYLTTARLTNLNKKRLKFENDHCEASAVIADILRNIDLEIKNSGIKVRTKTSDELPLVAVGEMELDQMIRHVLDNSIQAMPAGGLLRIQTSWLHQTQQVKIQIIDDGVGIPPEDLKHIYEPFFSAKHGLSHRSAGLGLSIVYALVNAAQGHIKVTSSLRKGTTVELVFPVFEPMIPPRSFLK